MKIVAVICARSQSTRFPNKMMVLIDGKPLLYRVVYQTKKSRLVDKVTVATVHGDANIPAFCSHYTIRWYCGEEDDILDRLYKGAQLYEADVVVRVWGDSPLVDPDIIDKTICYHFQMKGDYTYSTNHPLGQNVAVISMPALKRAWYEIKEPENRLWFHKYMIEKAHSFKIVPYNTGIGYSDLNYSVDTKEDLMKVEKWYEQGQLPDGRQIY